jgi:hypothetical protein
MAPIWEGQVKGPMPVKELLLTELPMCSPTHHQLGVVSVKESTSADSWRYSGPATHNILIFNPAEKLLFDEILGKLPQIHPDNPDLGYNYVEADVE